VSGGVQRAPRVLAGSFEHLYQASPDPWDYERSDYEREKYDATIGALAPGRFARGLEVGCSIGVLTERLAGLCESLVAIDFSGRAVTAARDRLAGTPHVEILRTSFPEQMPAGRWNLIVCSEVLYYLDEAALAEAMSLLDGQLRIGATVLAVSWRGGSGSQEPFRGDEVHDLMAARFARWHDLDGATPGYRLDRFNGDVC
jgi:predicted TPR repeat methyltransferase